MISADFRQAYDCILGETLESALLTFGMIFKSVKLINAPMTDT